MKLFYFRDQKLRRSVTSQEVDSFTGRSESLVAGARCGELAAVAADTDRAAQPLPIAVREHGKALLTSLYFAMCDTHPVAGSRNRWDICCIIFFCGVR